MSADKVRRKRATISHELAAKLISKSLASIVIKSENEEFRDKCVEKLGVADASEVSEKLRLSLLRLLDPEKYASVSQPNANHVRSEQEESGRPQSSSVLQSASGHSPPRVSDSAEHDDELSYNAEEDSVLLDLSFRPIADSESCSAERGSGESFESEKADYDVDEEGSASASQSLLIDFSQDSWTHSCQIDENADLEDGRRTPGGNETSCATQNSATGGQRRAAGVKRRLSFSPVPITDSDEEVDGHVSPSLLNSNIGAINIVGEEENGTNYERAPVISSNGEERPRILSPMTFSDSDEDVDGQGSPSLMNCSFTSAVNEVDEREAKINHEQTITTESQAGGERPRIVSPLTFSDSDAEDAARLSPSLLKCSFDNGGSEQREEDEGNDEMMEFDGRNEAANNWTSQIPENLANEDENSGPVGSQLSLVSQNFLPSSEEVFVVAAAAAPEMSSNYHEIIGIIDESSNSSSEGLGLDPQVFLSILNSI